MRIEAYTQVQQVYKTSTTKTRNVKKSKAASDQLELSSMGRDYRVAKQAIAAAPDVREELIAPLKKSVKAGTYQVSTESFADKLMEKIAQSNEEMR